MHKMHGFYAWNYMLSVSDHNYKPNPCRVLVWLGFIYRLHLNISTHSLIFHILDVDHTSWFNITEGIIVPNALSFFLWN